jgi:hypothetical protein
MTLLDHIVTVLIAGVCVLNSINVVRLRKDVTDLQNKVYFK